MKNIIGEAVVSCYVDAASLLVLTILLLFARRLNDRKNTTMRIFSMMCVYVMANSVFSFIYNAMYLQPAPWCHTVAIIFKTLRECSVLITITLWLMYVDHKLYGERIQHSPVFRLIMLPFAVILVLLVINMFTGIAFTFSQDNQLEAKPLLFIIFAVEFIYFCSAAFVVRYYDRKTTKTRFLRISPMIVSVIIASGTQFFTPYDIGILGYMAGVTMLCFSIIGEYRLVDEESGLYHKGYLSYLFDMAAAGKSDIHSALLLQADGNITEACRILYDILHKDGDVIRLEERKFLMFSGEQSRSRIQYLSSLVDEAAEKYNKQHPDDKVQITAYCRMRKAGEDSFSFLNAARDKKEAGDEVRGIVSMISELDRLDKELKFAADIQINMLPTNFPAFPDRTEFDLFASMTPAKEVGGDFYDFFLIDNDHLGLVIADVSGKGIPAALFMTVSKTLIKNQLMSGSDPATALERVNLQLCERNSSMMFVTVWLAVLEISTGRGMACNAGHENPGLLRAGEAFELLKYKHGVFIGVNKKARYENREFELHAGDCVFVYTDGVPEATNAEGKMFGEERMLQTLNQNRETGPEELIHRMRDAVNHFSDDTPQFDDITMLCLRYYGTHEKKEEQ